MKNFIMRPFELFTQEIEINQAIEEALIQNDQVSNTKAKLIYFFKIANLMLLLMNMILYLGILVVLVTTPFYPPIALLRLLPPLIFLPILRLFQTKWLPKVREVQMNQIGLDIKPIVREFE